MNETQVSSMEKDYFAKDSTIVMGLNIVSNKEDGTPERENFLVALDGARTGISAASTGMETT